jgi:hypothetical protein
MLERSTAIRRGVRLQVAEGCSSKRDSDTLRRMDVVSLCDLPASGFRWQPRAGTYALTVICKATFDLQPNQCALAPEQEEISDTETYWNDDPMRSVVVPSDRAPYKPRADVVLVGHAYAPKQQSVRSLMTRLLVGEMDKSIEVWCDRGVQKHTGQLLEGQRQAKMLLSWERTAGGPETNNPVGMPFDATPDRYGMVAIPSLQPPGVHFSRLGDTFTPIGYGPIAPHWPERAQKLYSHGARLSSGWEERPLPEYFNYAFFNVAPLDQQIAELRPNERIMLENLHPKHERLVTSLPGIRPRAIADRATGEREEIGLAADTLWIDTDRGICTLVWRGRITLRHPQEAGRVAFWVDGLPISSSTRAAPRKAPLLLNVRGIQAKASENATLTIVSEHDTSKAPILPFLRDAPMPPPPADISAGTPPPLLRALALNAKLDEGTGTIVSSMVEQAQDPLPFVSGAGALPNLLSHPSPGPLPARPHDGGGTAGAGSPPLPPPFVPPVPPSPMLIQATVPHGSGIDDEPETARGKKPLTYHPVSKAEFQDPTPPPMLGPLATAETAAKPEESKPDKIEPATPAPKTPVVPVEERLKLGDFPLERCAALAASVARRKSEKAAILKRNDLTPHQWTELETYWAEAIQEETKRGKTEMLSAYDQAYVAQLETERGTITVDEYAQLTVAAERGTERETLAKMDLPRGAMLRLRRVWLKRTAADASLAKRVREALEEE